VFSIVGSAYMSFSSIGDGWGRPIGDDILKKHQKSTVSAGPPARYLTVFLETV
jgi:hypothetical protein